MRRSAHTMPTAYTTLLHLPRKAAAEPVSDLLSCLQQHVAAAYGEAAAAGACQRAADLLSVLRDEAGGVGVGPPPSPQGSSASTSSRSVASASTRHREMAVPDTTPREATSRCVRACVRACMRACMRACVCACVRVCVCVLCVYTSVHAARNVRCLGGEGMHAAHAQQQPMTVHEPVCTPLVFGRVQASDYKSATDY